MTDDTIPVPPRGRWWARRWVIILATALVMVLGWRLLTPRLRLVGEFPVARDLPVISERGFLLCTGERQYEMRDWDGARLYRFEAPKSDATGWFVAPDVELRVVALSPDGRYAAAAVPAGKGAHVRIWRDGARTTDMFIPFERTPGVIRTSRDGSTSQKVAVADLLLDNNGRALYTVRPYYTATKTLCGMAYLVDDHQIASGQFLNEYAISPDWRTLTTSNTFYDLAFHKGCITTTARFTIPPHNYVSLWPLNDGVAITNEGTVYDASGKRSGTGEWQTEYYGSTTRYVRQFNKGKTRLFAPTTGDAWIVPTPSPCLVDHFTDDGHFAVAAYPPESITTFEDFLSEYDYFNWLRERPTRSTITIYERPGRRRVHMMAPINSITIGHCEYGSLDAGLWLSPDGHRLLLESYYGDDLSVKLYRW